MLGCGGGPKPGYLLCGMLGRGQRVFRTLRASQIHLVVIPTDWGPPAAGDPTCIKPAPPPQPLILLPSKAPRA